MSIEIEEIKEELALCKNKMINLFCGVIAGVVIVHTLFTVDLYLIKRAKEVKHIEMLIAIADAALAEREKKKEAEFFRELTQDELLAGAGAWADELNTTEDLNLTVVKGLPNKASK